MVICLGNCGGDYPFPPDSTRSKRGGIWAPWCRVERSLHAISLPPPQHRPGVACMACMACGATCKSAPTCRPGNLLQSCKTSNLHGLPPSPDGESFYSRRTGSCDPGSTIPNPTLVFAFPHLLSSLPSLAAGMSAGCTRWRQLACPASWPWGGLGGRRRRWEMGSLRDRTHIVGVPVPRGAWSS
ncbi:hypothetical protein CC85DRAFT_36370 [Cutaneotrichosporon oleaginosum]|uniref:Uncharacterized protein n=1 Tax=Cutaneotrichosporon oleaginosum TaxID=879819 RepID=A0A0J1B8A1_9TREE|nr:uncharacterized protein CC85DRAFT_36370 [Cutaneotrichosporon oleaginosum]KLT43994.1 hypothetical protein CC85DRAFT_36370 [Cutaneotrichosporon oleaginosum]TXT04059.1 hypothetical protein COLE_07756 [Cutaneotrichosporon oleaginosum]